MRKMLVDRANQLDRDYIKPIGKETSLPASHHVGAPQKLAYSLQCLRTDARVYRVRICEQIAVESVAHPPKKATDRFPILKDPGDRVGAILLFEIPRVNDPAVAQIR